MTDLSEELYQLLGATTGVTDIIGHRFYTVRAPQQTIMPFLVLEYPSHKEEWHLRGPADLENDIVRFHMFGRDRAELRRLRTAISDMMANPQSGSPPAPMDFQAVHRFGTELPEDDLQTYHLVADYSVWHDRS